MTDAKALAQAATTPETFNFAAAVLDRSYPEIDVPVYLNEKSIQRYLSLRKEQNELFVRLANSDQSSVEQAEALSRVDNELNALVEELKSEKYVVRITGVSPERQIALDKEAYEAFPKEFEETTHTLTGATVRTEIPSEEREAHFAYLLRREHLVSVTAPNGAVDNDFEDLEKVRSTWTHLPVLARHKIDEAINETTIAVDFYRELVDEVF